MTDFTLIFHLLIAFGAFQAIFIAIIFITNGHQSLPKRFFSIFLIVEGFTLVERLLVETQLIVNVPHLLGVSYPLSFVKAPILFLMALAIVNPKFKLRKIHSLHFVIYLIMQLINIPFYFQTAEFKLETVAAFMDFIPTYETFEFYLYVSFYFHIGIYIAASIVVLSKYKTHFKNNGLANWFLKVLWLYGAVLIIGFLYFVIRPLDWFEVPLLNTISMLIMTFLIQSIAYTFFAKSNLFNLNQGLSLEKVDRMIKHEQLIKSKLEKEKVYTNDLLSLEEFARSIDLSKKEVSDLINQRFGLSFKELINQYRVEEAKSIMKNEIDPKVSLIAIAEEAGFNNKVSFYRAFKKYTGKSPSDFLKTYNDRLSR